MAKKKMTIWQVLNEPVVHVSAKTASQIIRLAVVLMAFVWLSPYLGVSSSELGVRSEELGVRSEELGVSRVAGASAYLGDSRQEIGDSTVSGLRPPTWYYAVSDLPVDLSVAFGEAAMEVLDVSEPLIQMAETYQPGTQALWDAWLELMADPYPI